MRQIKHITYSKLIRNNYQDLLKKTGYDDVNIKQISRAKTFYSQAMAEKSLEKRLNYINKALEIHPYFVSALNKRAHIYDELGKYKKALEDYNKAIKLAPWRASLYTSRSFALLMLGRYKEALKDLGIALSLNPEDKIAYNNRADVLKRLGNYEKAIENIKKALEIDSKFDLAWATLAEIKAHMGKEEFFNCLKKAIEFGFPLHKYYILDDIYNEFLTDSRFQQLFMISKEKNERFI
ncbi:MAG: tetratricopeptide repeat protein [Candidatus Desulfofervidaceae bacterium]|nr:tetratricopeptide repeat protein [Candidatus Desulfofervidaceae bacterium]